MAKLNYFLLATNAGDSINVYDEFRDYYNTAGLTCFGEEFEEHKIPDFYQGTVFGDVSKFNTGNNPSKPGGLIYLLEKLACTKQHWSWGNI